MSVSLHMESTDAVGFRGTRYQRSLPVYESDEYNFFNATLRARNTDFHA